MIRFRIPFLAFFTGMLLFGGLALAQNRLVIYEFSHATPAYVEQALRTMMTNDGTEKLLVNAPRREAMVLASEAVHRQIAGAMKQIDKPRRNVSIKVDFRGGSYGVQRSVTLEGARGYEELPPRLGNSSSRYRVQPMVRNQTMKQIHNQTQMLTVIEGGRAELMVGERVPFQAWLENFGTVWLPQQSNLDFEWDEVGSFLLVEPTVLGDGPRPLIRLKVIPELRGKVDERFVRLEYTKAITTVTVASGQTVNIGGLRKHPTFYEKFLAGYNRSGQAEAVNISVTPSVFNTGSTAGPPRVEQPKTLSGIKRLGPPPLRNPARPQIRIRR